MKKTHVLVGKIAHRGNKWNTQYIYLCLGNIVLYTSMAVEELGGGEGKHFIVLACNITLSVCLSV